MIAMCFLNASVLERKALNRNLSWGFPFGNLLPKTRVLKHRVLEQDKLLGEGDSRDLVSTPYAMMWQDPQA